MDEILSINPLYMSDLTLNFFHAKWNSFGLEIADKILRWTFKKFTIIC